MSIYLGTTPIADGASTALLAGKADTNLGNTFPEGEIAELIAEREAKVREIKERFPYSEVKDDVI
jgi:hypothetical protein